MTHFLIPVTEKCGSFLRTCFRLSHFFGALKAILVKVTSIISAHQLEFSDAEIKPCGCFLVITALPINSDETWAAFWNSFRLECIIFSVATIFKTLILQHSSVYSSTLLNDTLTQLNFHESHQLPDLWFSLEWIYKKNYSPSFKLEGLEWLFFCFWEKEPSSK